MLDALNLERKEKTNMDVIMNSKQTTQRKYHRIRCSHTRFLSMTDLSVGLYGKYAACSYMQLDARRMNKVHTEIKNRRIRNKLSLHLQPGFCSAPQVIEAKMYH